MARSPAKRRPGLALLVVVTAAAAAAHAHAHAATKPATGHSHGHHTGTALVAEAESFVGDPYVYGAKGPDAFDCSGLVQWSLHKLGITAPPSSEDQWGWTVHISYSQLAPGDLIFEQWAGDTQQAPGHVVVYAGNGQVVEAPQPGQTVRVRAWSPNETDIVGYGAIPGVTY